MIRSNLPLPFLYRLRLRAGDAARRAAAAPCRRSVVRRPAGGEGEQAWLRFVDHYERFTEVLCAAAKDGCDSRKENEYAQMRFWFMGNYYRTAARIRPVLETEFEADSGGPCIADYAGQKRTLDALEAPVPAVDIA